MRTYDIIIIITRAHAFRGGQIKRHRKRFDIANAITHGAYAAVVYIHMYILYTEAELNESTGKVITVVTPPPPPPPPPPGRGFIIVTAEDRGGYTRVFTWCFFFFFFFPQTLPETP